MSKRNNGKNEYRDIMLSFNMSKHQELLEWFEKWRKKEDLSATGAIRRILMKFKENNE